ncbi:MAG: M48 family metallopeptidase [Pseudomonadales bacterium]|nr:M48 family metallopeptidase [Halioglobus sp.]MCP5193814.1 M48 family metallopeptidase [Pseudomonadales bacterium]
MAANQITSISGTYLQPTAHKARELRHARFNIPSALQVLSSTITMIRLLLLLATLVVPAASAQSYKIPGFGDGNAALLNQEYYLGRAWLMSFRRQAPILNDALVQDYVEGLVYRLAERSRLTDRRLEIIVVNNPTINAFAIPGGIVGVHSGLLAQAETQAQFSSVLAHELAHLSQRHFSRDLDPNGHSAAAMAGLLNSLVYIAADPAVTEPGGQAAAGSRLRYSRLNEQEADDLGIQNQVAAGLDPGGAAAMFVVLQNESPDGGLQSSDFLRTHPITEIRIADAKNRAATYPIKIYEDSRDFQLMRARVALSFIKDNDTAIAHFREQRAKGGRYAVPAQYALVLALTRSGEVGEARELLAPMREFAPDNITYKIAEADIDIKAAKYDAAIALLQKGLSLSPDNHPLTMSLANAYFKGEQYSKADKLLSGHARSHPGDAQLWLLLAEIQEKAGNALGAHQSRAEYYALNDAIERAIAQLNAALSLAKNQITAERIQTRMTYFETIGQALDSLR